MATSIRTSLRSIRSTPLKPAPWITHRITASARFNSTTTPPPPPLEPWGIPSPIPSARRATSSVSPRIPNGAKSTPISFRRSTTDRFETSMRKLRAEHRFDYTDLRSEFTDLRSELRDLKNLVMEVKGGVDVVKDRSSMYREMRRIVFAAGVVVTYGVTTILYFRVADC
jgi:hypothetical protein